LKEKKSSHNIFHTWYITRNSNLK